MSGLCELGDQIRRVALGSGALVATLVLSGCLGAPVEGGSGRLAPSVKALIEQALERDDLADWDRAALEKASESGRVDQADYAEGMDLWDSCMKSAGYEWVRTTHLNGVIQFKPPPGDVSAAEAEEQARAQADCYQTINVATQEIYALQEANPGLLADFSLAAVNCLREAGVVGDEFTKEDFDKLSAPQESGPAEWPFDVMDERAQTCLYSLGYSIVVADE